MCVLSIEVHLTTFPLLTTGSSSMDPGPADSPVSWCVYVCVCVCVWSIKVHLLFLCLEVALRPGLVCVFVGAVTCYKCAALL